MGRSVLASAASLGVVAFVQAAGPAHAQSGPPTPDDEAASAQEGQPAADAEPQDQRERLPCYENPNQPNNLSHRDNSYFNWTTISFGVRGRF